MGRQITYLTLTSNQNVDGYVREYPTWYTLSTLARLDLLKDWQGELERLYQEEWKAWARELGVSARDTESRIIRHLIAEIQRLETDNAGFRAEVAFLKEEVK